MIFLPQDYLSSVCEIKTLQNSLLATGTLHRITDEYIEIAAKVGSMGLAEYKTAVKINIYNSSLGFKVLVGEVYTSSQDYLRVINLDTLVEYERRNFFRVEVTMHTIVQEDLPAAEEGEEAQEPEDYPAMINNVSLSGFLFTSQRRLDVNKRYILKIKLMRRHCTFKFLIKHEYEIGDGRYQYGCAFLEGSPGATDNLCAFIFQKQRESINRNRERR